VYDVPSESGKNRQLLDAVSMRTKTEKRSSWGPRNQSTAGTVYDRLVLDVANTTPREL
jgi:hypothetical protein